MDDEPVLGEVLRWSDEDGLVFAHYSDVRDRSGYRSPEPGRPVWFR